mmetsp:Transcript_19124/g.40074  ORF Transcript_19124/g.40074 Transcript_19124/m.40074 type:complete len:297 (-) Transcript_19124:338-1228(-)
MGFRIVLWRSPGMKICGRSSVVVVGVVVVVVVVVVAVVVDVVVVTAGVFVVMVVVVAAGVVSSSISDSTISNSISGTSEPSSSSSSVSTTSTSKSPSSSSGPSTKSISAVAAAATVVVSNVMPTTSDSLPSSLDCSDTHNSASMGLTVGTSVRILLGPVAIPPSMVSSMISISIKVNSGPSLSKEGTVVVEEKEEPSSPSLSVPGTRIITPSSSTSLPISGNNPSSNPSFPSVGENCNNSPGTLSSFSISCCRIRASSALASYIIPSPAAANPKLHTTKHALTIARCLARRGRFRK